MKQDQFFDSQRHCTDETVALYVDALKLNKLNALPTSVLMHVEDCSECKKRIMELSEFMRDQPYSAQETHPFLDRKADVQQGSWKLVYQIAAVLVVGIGIAWFVTVRPVSEDGSVNEQTVAKNISNAYTAYPPLENIYTTHFRSQAIEIISPKDSSSMTGIIAFAWKWNSPSVISITIFDNTGKEVFTRSVKESRLTYTEKLPAGLYYWRLVAGDETVYLGKFFVK